MTPSVAVVRMHFLFKLGASLLVLPNSPKSLVNMTSPTRAAQNYAC